MNSLAITRPNWREPNSQLLVNLHTLVIPLIPHFPASATLNDYRHQQRLVVTVELEGCMVHQRWLLEPDGASASAVSRLPNPVSRSERDDLVAEDLVQRVQYHLPRGTLDQFTDLERKGRVAPHEPMSFQCPIFARLTQLILPSISSPDLYSASFMHQFVMLFCSHVSQARRTNSKEQMLYRGGLSTNQKRRATQLLTEQLNTNLSLSALAKECGLSKSHFARSFRASFGQPVHQWLIAQRVERAKEMLICSGEPLLEIAFQVGFSDQASFTRTFARLTGTSPGRWRRQCRD
jgi:AraC family transcriptional regulator